MKNAGKACNNRLYRHIRTFEKIVKNYFVIYKKYISKYGIKWSCFVLESQQELFLAEALRKTLMLYTYTKYVSTK